LKNPQAVNIPPTTTVGGDSWVQKSFAGTTTSNGQSVVVQVVVASDNHPASSPSTKSFTVVYGTMQQLFATANTTYFHPMLQSFKFTWCQQLPKFDFQTWTLVVPPALEQSGRPSFLPVSDRLFLQEALLKPTRLERGRFQPGIAPPPCMYARLPTWPGLPSAGCP